MKNRKRGWLWLLPFALLAALALGLWIVPRESAQPAEGAAAPTRDDPAPTRDDPAPDREATARLRREALPAPYLLEEGSFFSDFTIRGDRVYFLCSLCVENPGEELRAVTITGDFLEDAEGGLLETADGQVPTHRVLSAYRFDDYRNGSFLELSDEELAAAVDRRGRWGEAPDLFLLQPGKNLFWVIFSAEHGEAAQKQDRLLPPIAIRPLRDVTSEEIRTETGCRIFTDDAFGGLFYLADGERCGELGMSFGGYGLCSAVPWDYDENGTVDLLYTYSWGSGMHRSILALFDRTKWEERELYGYFPDSDSPGSDLLVERETDEGGEPAFTVYTVDVQVQNYDFTDLRFTKKEEAGVVSVVMVAGEKNVQPLFWPASKEFLPPTNAPSLCWVSLGDEEYTLSEEKAAELFWLCREAEKQASPDSFYTLGGERPVITLTFPLDDSAEWRIYYVVDENDRCLSGYSLASARAATQLPAGTYEKLLAALEEAEAAPRNCSVEYGGGRRTVEDETAAELHWICTDAQRRGESIVPTEAKPEMLCIFLVFLDQRAPGEFWRVYADDSGTFADGLVYAPTHYVFPAGTFDKLLDTLSRNGELPAPAGERIAGNEVYGLFEEDGVYALQFYSPERELVWAYGPSDRELRVTEEEPGLWSMGLSAGPSPSLSWAVYYKPETGQLSDSLYGVLARDRERVLCSWGKSLLLRGIFDGEDRVVLESFSEPLAPTVDPFVSAAFTEDGKAVVVTYLAGEDDHEVTETIPLPREGGTAP